MKLPLQKHTFLFLTIRKCAEDGRGAEAAITCRGVRPHLHLVLSGPAEVRQHGLVSDALCVTTLFLATPLLCRVKKMS